MDPCTKEMTVVEMDLYIREKTTNKTQILLMIEEEAEYKNFLFFLQCYSGHEEGQDYI